MCVADRPSSMSPSPTQTMSIPTHRIIDAFRSHCSHSLRIQRLKVIYQNVLPIFMVLINDHMHDEHGLRPVPLAAIVHHLRLADANWRMFIANYRANYNYQFVHRELYSLLSLCMVPCARLPNQRHSEQSKLRLLLKRAVHKLQHFRFLAEHVLIIRDFVHHLNTVKYVVRTPRDFEMPRAQHLTIESESGLDHGICPLLALKQHKYQHHVLSSARLHTLRQDELCALLPQNLHFAEAVESPSCATSTCLGLPKDLPLEIPAISRRRVSSSCALLQAARRHLHHPQVPESA